MAGFKPFLGLALLAAAAALGAQVTKAPVPAQAAAAPVETPAASPVLARGTVIPAADLEKFVDGYVRRAMADEHGAGVTVGIVQNDQPLLLKGYGMASLDPVRPVDPRRTLFRIGSVSKTMTWTLMMREVEKGRLKLTDPVNQYLPPELQVPDQGFKNPIRIIDLMSHSPGFEDSGLGHLFVDTPERILPAAEYLARHRPDRVREPGTISAYSNYGVALAGEILARLNGVDFQTLADRDIFGPLQMQRSTYREPYEPRAGIPQPMPKALAADRSHEFKYKGGRYQPSGYDYVTTIAAAGSISTTAEDMIRYMRLHLNGGTLDGVKLYGPETARLFRTPVLNVPEGVNGWAHGFGMSRMPGGFASFSHSGGTTSFFTDMVLVPELNLGIFISTNTSGAGGIVGSFADAVVDEFYVKSPPIRRAGDPALKDKAGNYAGNYITTRRHYSGLEKFVGLLGGINQVSVSDDGYLVTAGGGSARSWAPTGKAGQFQAADGDDLLNFVLDENGKATGVYLGSFLDRAGPLMSATLFAAVAALAALTGFGIWLAFFARKRVLSPLVGQRRSEQALLAAAGLWLASILVFGVWMATFTDIVGLLYHFPPALLVIASTLALFGTIATFVALAFMVMSGRRSPAAGREGGWTMWGTARQGLAIALFLLLALLVAVRGGLLPWA
ncbi:serine hydrolase domain-containing protein [Sphingosinicella rhizophila]|uniref:Serine hydrolase domain-containing protein n=1 Tax=Sphingosinicella rhizophila TaxID=3050082 RepID=A0ABU3Q7U5_9SPHN|nr:serine hydrolase domain-containing protein [Sphingosinicella sp. GR2756]MDT9599020.1 serine hydrolase domain-containing protein [Sphingosinicella sp. GR2756]